MLSLSEVLAEGREKGRAIRERRIRRESVRKAEKTGREEVKVGRKGGNVRKMERRKHVGKKMVVR